MDANNTFDSVISSHVFLFYFAVLSSQFHDSNILLTFDFHGIRI